MFTKVLECPECRQRFNYEHEGEIFPESITCPECGSEREYNRFAVLIFCDECRVKLKIPLDILFNPQLACPECGAAIQATAAYQGDTAISTFEDSGELQSQQPTRMLQDGEIFDKFQIIRLLGSGGMAEVYLAEHLLLKKQCAVKLMRNSGGNANGAVSGKRFVREAQLSHQIDHPNIVKVFDVGCDSQTGYLFIAMEYVEGPTLNDLLMERQLTEEELFDILKAMANALNALIESRVVHRDIKPSKIMVGKDGVYKLMDLGIAKSENNYNAGDMTLTLDQSSIGTPNYASPEQCRSAHTADFRSDIYSLGATLYHLASGRLPFTGATPVETILNVMQTEAVPLQEYRSDLSDKFINLLKKMMQKNPLDRPQTPDAILAEIYRNDESSSEEEFPVVEAEDAGEAERSWISRMIMPVNLSFAQRIKRIAILLLVVLGALFVIYKINKPWISIYNWLNAATRSSAKTVTRPAPVKYHFGTFAGKMHRLARHKESLQIKGGKRLYPLVKITPAPRENLKMCFDSSRMMTDYKGVINGKVSSGAHLAFAEKEFVLEQSSDVNKHIGLTFREFSAKEFTLSLDLCIFNASNGCILRMNDIQILFEQRFVKLAVGGYYTSTNLLIPQNRWFNLTLVLSNNARKLTLYSGNRMVGSWHVPEHSLNGKFNAVDFFTFPPLQDKNDKLDQLPTAELNRVMRKFTGSISRLYLWDKAAGVNALSAPDYQELQTADSANTLPDVWFTPKTAEQTAPEVQAAETADRTAPQAENSTGTAAAQNPEGSLNWRLQFCINELQKAPNTSRTDYLKKQIAALEKQIQYRKNIDSAKAQYSADYGKEFTYLLNNFYNIPLHSEQKKGVESRLFDSLKMQNCDPDIEIGGEPFPVHLADKMSRFSRLTEFQALLAEKYSDGDRVIKHYDQFAAKHWKNRFIQQWYKQGVEDIDNAKTFTYLKNNPQKIAPVNGFALSCIKYRQYGLKLVDFDDLKQLLL
ncbi:MAG: protein kinase, partial [Lentisphaeria bacterium]|nr:protein kinase [Lentisphaeria bacterium]